MRIDSKLRMLTIKESIDWTLPDTILFQMFKPLLMQSSTELLMRLQFLHVFFGLIIGSLECSEIHGRVANKCVIEYLEIHDSILRRIQILSIINKHYRA
jgi:hypothetical protein